MTSDSWDCIIIGGGAAGLSAAQMLGRARRRTLVLDEGSPRNRFADHMHGVLGHDGRAPADVYASGRGEAAAYGVEFRSDRALSVTRTERGLTVRTSEGPLHSRTILLATGMTDRLPDTPGLASRWGKTVLHCPYCHGWEVRDSRLGVLVSHPMHAHLAAMVRQWSPDVTIFVHKPALLDARTRARIVARSSRIVTSAVVRVEGDGATIDAVVTEDGKHHVVDALFAGGTCEPHDGCVAALGLDTRETPMGRLIAVQSDGATSDPRVWAAGNVVDPSATVPVAMGAGSIAGARINAFLVDEDTDRAIAGDVGWHHVAPVEFWEERYTSTERAWSGKVNPTLADIVAGLAPGSALDLGCGEGGDVIWLSEHGWRAHGIDISPTAIARGAAVAAQRGLDARLEAADLSVWEHSDSYDLVAASFLHSPVALPRSDVLRRASEAVAAGGHLLLVTHAAAPPWAEPEHVAHHTFLSARDEADALGLDPELWDEVRVEEITRTATGPNGRAGEMLDGVVLMRRRVADRRAE